MWVLISRRLRRWIVLSVAVPLVARLAGLLGRRLEERSGRPTPVSRSLIRASTLARRRAGGPASTGTSITSAQPTK